MKSLTEKTLLEPTQRQLAARRKSQRWRRPERRREDQQKRPQQEDQGQHQNDVNEYAVFHCIFGRNSRRMRLTTSVVSTIDMAMIVALFQSINTIARWYSSVASIKTRVPPKIAGVT